MKICIIGGGTTGWWAAGYLEKQHPDFDITLIESSDVPRIGVGESTLPQVAEFFRAMDLDEEQWMPEASAVKKLGNIKSGWNNNEDLPFTFWSNEGNAFDKWAKKYLSGKLDLDSFNKLNEEKYYAYHMDAERAGEVVKNSCKRVTHIIDTLDSLPEGYDLYIDCTGFQRKFVNDMTMMQFEHHLVDSAWVCPFELDYHPTGYTQSIARDYGWQFVIDLTSRIGTGYVFASQLCSTTDAYGSFMEYNKHRTPFMDKKPRLIQWKPEVLESPWSGNVVAIGLSNGFLDPLESNALFMTQYSITLLSQVLAKGTNAELYNRAMRKVWRDNSAYILHHYMLSNRDDTEFWRYYRDFDVTKSLWDNYQKYGNRYTNLYPDSIWATLGLYYNEFTHYKGKK